jgi:hyperosmotically inducible periplasmic protein
MKRRQQITSLALCLGLLTTAAVGTFTGCASSSTNRSGGPSGGQYMDDKTLQQQVSTALDNNAGYKFNQVNVGVDHGSAQLSGYVETAEQKMKANDIAKSVPGVTSVENNIILRPATPGTRP